MTDHVYSIDQISNAKMLELLKAHQSFIIKNVNVEERAQLIEIIEKILGELGIKCKVYTEFPTNYLRYAVSNFEFIEVASLCIHKMVKWGRQKVTWSDYYEIEDRLFVRGLAVKYNKPLFGD